MKRIAIITMGVKLENEKGYTRFRYIAEMLANAGYQVDLITTTFQHWEKTQRDIKQVKEVAYPFNLRFVFEPGYKKNVDLRRIHSHKVASSNLRKLFAEDGNYDLIYCEIPPNDVAITAARYAKEKGIPFITDVNDLWPEAMRMVFDLPIINDMLLFFMKRDAEEAYASAAAIVGTSDEYRDRPVKKQKLDIPRITVYVGNEISKFDEGAAKYDVEVAKAPEEFWVTYAGTIGKSYDIKTMVLAGQELLKQGFQDVKIKILGGGPSAESLEKLAKENQITNVEFVGYLPQEKMATYLKKSDVLVNSFVKKAPQSIVTKIGDYLAAGRPMINTCSSPEFREKVDNDGFGVNVEAENVQVLTQAILRLKDDEAGRVQMGIRAREIAETQFDRPTSYVRILELIRSLIGE